MHVYIDVIDVNIIYYIHVIWKMNVLSKQVELRNFRCTHFLKNSPVKEYFSKGTIQCRSGSVKEQFRKDGVK